MSADDAATLLAKIVHQWLKDALTCDWERRDLARFLELPEQRVAQMAQGQSRHMPAGRPSARTATSRHTFAERTPRTR